MLMCKEVRANNPILNNRFQLSNTSMAIYPFKHSKPFHSNHSLSSNPNLTNSPNPTTDPVLQPFQLKHLTFKNRIMSTSHSPSYVVDAKPKLRYQLYHEEKAKGGIGLTMFGGSSNVAPDSPSAFGQINVGTDQIIPYFKEFSERIHQHGVPLMCQLTHMGRRTFWHVEHWLPPVAPSCVREPMHRSFPKIMEDHDILRIVKCFGQAARRCKEGGLDGCELLTGDHLVHQFLSPLTNLRTDKYGGSLENRMRFCLEVLEEMRKMVGSDYIIGCRLTVDEQVPGGISLEEGTHMASLLAKTGLIDFLNLNRGTVASYSLLSVQLPGMGYPSASHLPYLENIKSAVSGIPVFHSSRIDISTARYALRAGILDMVGMTRAHIADPYLVNKIKNGEEHRIRPCVGASFCIDRIYEGGDALCIQNAATGRESTMPHKIPKSQGPVRKVVVVGAGPAGLEAARVAALRGHTVVVFEATNAAGGQIRLAANVPWRKSLIGISDWLVNEVQILGVTLHYNTYVEEDHVYAENPDVVIIATGGVPNLSFFPGNEHVVSTWDVLGGSVVPGRHVLVFDDNGKYPGPSCAEFLAGKGSKVEVVTPDRMLGVEIGATTFPVFYKNLYNLGVTVTPDSRLVSVRKSDNSGKLVVVLKNEYNHTTKEQEVDQVVVEHGTLPAEDLYFSLKQHSLNLGEVDIEALLEGKPQKLIRNENGKFQLFRVGDAVASRNIHASIYDSLRLCKDL